VSGGGGGLVGGTEVGVGVGTEVAGPSTAVGGGGVLLAGAGPEGTGGLVGPDPAGPPEPESPDPTVLPRATPSVAVGLGVAEAVGPTAGRSVDVGARPVPSSPIASTVAATAVWI